MMERLHAARDRYFGNARTARNLFDDVVAHQAERLLAAGAAPDRAALMELTRPTCGPRARRAGRE